MRYAIAERALVIALWGAFVGCDSRGAIPDRSAAPPSGPAVILEPSEGEQLFIGRERVPTLIKVDPVTGGARELFVFQRVMDPGASLGRHRHDRDDEIIFVHAGELTASLEGADRQVTAGGMLFVPAGAWMNLRNSSNAPAVVLIVFAAPHMAEYIRSLGTPPGEPTRDLTPDLLRTLATRHHVTFADQ